MTSTVDRPVDTDLSAPLFDGVEALVPELTALLRAAYDGREPDAH